MLRISALCLAAALWPAIAAAQRPDVTIVFNVDQRAFVCWFEGQAGTPLAPPTISGCPFPNAHVFRDNVHFYRGQRVSIRLIGARIADSFSVDVKVDDLITPGIPVFGSDVALPALQLIEPDSRLALAAGVALVSGPVDIVNTRLVPLIDKAEPAEYQKILEGVIADANRVELGPLLDGGVTRVTARLDALLAAGGQIQQTASGIQADVTNHLTAFSGLRKTYCAAGAPASTADFASYLQSLLAFRQVVERQKALQAQVEAVALPALATTVAALQRAAASDVVQRATAYNTTTLSQFLAEFRALFLGVSRAATIAGIKIATGPDRYVKADNTEPPFLATINALQAVPPTAASLAILQKNLAILSQFEPSLSEGLKRLTDARQAMAALNTYLGRPAGPPPLTVAGFNDAVSAIAVDTILTVDAANCVARTMPLPDDLTIPLSDAWFASKEVTVTLKRSNRFNLLAPGVLQRPLADPFGTGSPAQPAQRAAADDTAKATPAAAAAKTGGEKPAEKPGAEAAGEKPAPAPQAGAAAPQTQKPAEPAASSAETIGTGKFRIRNLYHFQIALGFMRAWTSDTKYALVSETVKVDGADVTNQLFVRNRERDYRFLPTVDVLFYPWERDFFPNMPRHGGDRRSWYQNVGGLAGFSLTDPTRDFFFGGVYMTDAGVGIKGGWHLGYSDRLPDDVQLNVPLVQKSTILEETLDKGYFVGVEFNAGLFRDLFGVLVKK